jgi:signal transduction histidine kinase
LELGYRIAGTESYVDESGSRITTGGAGRTVTPILDQGRQIAIVVHDASIPLDDYLRSAILSVARLTATTATMQAESRERVSQLARSRTRLVEAADDERRRISARIDTGPGQRLREVEHLLSVAVATLQPGDADHLGAISQEVSTAADELARLARGALPRLVVDDGLRAALVDVAARFPCPVSVDVTSVRLKPIVESTTYFVCAEALANVAKHAGASRVSVAVTLEGDAVKASIVDDGRGGAPSSPDGRVRGSGLDGLVDRVEALNGRLVIESHEGRGTALHLWIPEAITASGSTA